MRFIVLDEDMRVISIRYGNGVVEGEMKSDTGNIGQIMQNDGTFIDPEPIESQEPEPTLKEMQETQMAIMSGIFDIYLAQLSK